MLEDREQWELDRLADPSLAQEIGLLRVRVAELLTRPEPDWKETLRAIEVLARMVRIQQGLPGQEPASAETVREFGRHLEQLLRGD